MAVPAGTYKVRFRAQLGTDATEEAIFGFHIRNADTASDDTVGALAEHCRNAFLAHFSGRVGDFSTGVIMTECAVYELDSTNHTVRKAVATFPSSGTGSWVGTASTSLPWECSPVISLYGYPKGSFVANAARKRGRLYLPPPATSIISSNQGIINNTAVDNLRTDFQAVLEQVNDIPSGLTQQARVVILSAVGGFRTDVQDVFCTSEVRSQRRRERSQAINHTSIGTLTP